MMSLNMIRLIEHCSLDQLYRPQYPNLLHLQIEARLSNEDFDNARCSPYVENAFVDVFTRTTKLMTYKVDVFPITEKIVTAMTTNDAQLKCLELHTKGYVSLSENNRLVTSDYQLFMSSKPAHTIKSLSISVDRLPKSEAEFVYSTRH